MYPSQIQHYLAIKDLIPTNESLTLLNKIQTQWSASKGGWDLIYDPLIDNYSMTKEQANEFMDNIEDTADNTFINFNHLQLVNKFGYNNYSINIENKQFSYKTIITNTNAITYQDILDGIVNVIPDFIKYFTINKLEFGGFNKNGLPIIKTDIDF